MKEIGPGGRSASIERPHLDQPMVCNVDGKILRVADLKVAEFPKLA